MTDPDPSHVCSDTLAPGSVICNDTHCMDYQYSSNFHSICLCQNPDGSPIKDCDPKNSNYPVSTGQCYNNDTGAIQNITPIACAQLGWPWYMQQCYCCCTCFAANTPVASPDGFRAIADYAVGDEVLAASGADNSWAWSPQTVTFSNGSPPSTATGPNAGTIMIMMEYGDGRAVIASPNQLFMLPDGKMKRADQLVPGEDALVDRDNGKVSINRLTSGYFTGAIHDIATSTPTYEEWDGSLDTHLIDTNGIVSGDYLLQLYQHTEKMAPHLEDPDAPHVGTEAYRTAAPHLMVKPFVVGLEHAAGGTEVSAPDFRAHAESAAYIPDSAAPLFSGQQELYLMDPDIPKRGFADTTNVQSTEYYIQLYRGFYPDVSIYLDWENLRPNVFAFTEYGQKTVVISGEFLRLGALYGPAMAMALSAGIAQCDMQLTSNDLGRALYPGIGVVMQNALQGPDSMATLMAGVTQFNTLLTALAAKDDKATDGCLSASCINSVINAAVGGDQLPFCAGGEEALLQLQSAHYGMNGLRVTFSRPLDQASATKTSNYGITPSGTITGAQLVSTDPSSVQLAVKLGKGTYAVNATGVEGSDGSTLDPAHSSAPFNVMLM